MKGRWRSMGLHPLSAARKTLGDQAYRAIRDEIVSLRLKPGQMIYEKEIAAELGISRTPLREAFHMLLQEELIRIIPNRGAQIAYLSEQKVIEAQFVRESLESSAFAKAAEVWNDLDPVCRQAESDVMRLIEEQKKAVQDGDYIRFVQLDEDYHNRIMELANSRTLLLMVDQMRAHLNRFRYLELQEAHHEQEALNQHERLFQAVRKGDKPGTMKLLLEHLRLLEAERPAIMAKYSHYFQ